MAKSETEKNETKGRNGYQKKVQDIEGKSSVMKISPPKLK